MPLPGAAWGHPGGRLRLNGRYLGATIPRTGAERGADWRGCEQHDRNDLGLDRIYVYRPNTVIGALNANTPPYVQLARGRGPRHASFHPSGR
jgi:hypothetical protein